MSRWRKHPESYQNKTITHTKCYLYFKRPLLDFLNLDVALVHLSRLFTFNKADSGRSERFSSSSTSNATVAAKMLKICLCMSICFFLSITIVLHNGFTGRHLTKCHHFVLLDTWLTELYWLRFWELRLGLSRLSWFKYDKRLRNPVAVISHRHWKFQIKTDKHWAHRTLSPHVNAFLWDTFLLLVKCGCFSVSWAEICS